MPTIFEHEPGYEPSINDDVVDFVVFVIEDGHAVGNVILPQTQVFGYATIEEKIVGDLSLPKVYYVGTTGYGSTAEGDFNLPAVTVSGTCQNNIFTLPKIGVSGYTGAQSDVDNGLAVDLESGYILPQIEVSGTCTLSYIVGDFVLPQIKINIVDRNRDGEEDDLIWVDTDGDGEPDTEFVDPIHIDTDGDGVPDTWVEDAYNGSIELFLTGFYNLKNVDVKGYSGATGDYTLPSVSVEGTMECEQIMDIVIDVPKPKVVGSLETSAGFNGIINVPKPEVVGSISQNPVISIIVNAPLPKVDGDLSVAPPDDWEAIINIPKPIVSGIITTSDNTDSELTFGDTPQCIQ